MLGIRLSNLDIDAILLLFEDKKRYNSYRNISAIFYQNALKSLIPTLSKNEDKLIVNKNNSSFAQ
jgi:hypothetical protein